MKQGCLITFEGGEGAGKSSLIASLATHLRSNGYEVLTTREPGGTSVGEEIRNIVLHSDVRLAAETELLLFLASRAEHIASRIAPAVKEGKIVLCDRFNDSTIVYQGIARGLGLERVQTICNEACGEPKPLLTLFLDVPPEVGLARSDRATGERDRIEREGKEFHEHVREGFQRLASLEPQRIKTIDATQTAQTVLEQAITHTNDALSLHHV